MSKKYDLVCWPESQQYMDEKDFNDHAILLNDDDSVRIYGSAAYMIETAWLEKIKQKITKKTTL